MPNGSTRAVSAAVSAAASTAVTTADGHRLLPLIKYYKTPDAVANVLRQKVLF